MMTPSSLPSNWWTVTCPKKCGPSRSLFDQYTALGVATTIPALRCELFRSRNLEAEKLPPTRATQMSHILCTNFVTMIDTSYSTPHPLPLEENGWMLAGDVYVPVPCLFKPAPVAVLKVIKYGCKTSCKGHCS